MLPLDPSQIIVLSFEILIFVFRWIYIKKFVKVVKLFDNPKLCIVWTHPPLHPFIKGGDMDLSKIWHSSGGWKKFIRNGW